MAMVQVDLNAYWNELRSVVFSSKRYEPLRRVAFHFNKVPVDVLRFDTIKVVNYGFEVPVFTGMLYVFVRGKTRYPIVPIGYYKDFEPEGDTIRDEVISYYKSESPVDTKSFYILAFSSPSFGGAGNTKFEPEGYGAIALVLPSVQWAELLGYKFTRQYRFTLEPLFERHRQSIVTVGTYEVKGNVMMETFVNNETIPMLIWKWHTAGANYLRRLYNISSDDESE